MPIFIGIADLGSRCYSSRSCRGDVVSTDSGCCNAGGGLSYREHRDAVCKECFCKLMHCMCMLTRMMITIHKSHSDKLMWELARLKHVIFCTRITVERWLELNLTDRTWYDTYAHFSTIANLPATVTPFFVTKLAINFYSCNRATPKASYQDIWICWPFDMRAGCWFWVQ